MEEEKYYTFECKGKTLEAKAAVIPDKFTGIIHSDFLDRPAVNTINWVQPDEFIRCPHCGELAKLDPQVYTSMPPKYGYKCSHCGKSGFIFCHEAHIITDPNWKPWFDETQPSELLTSYAECMICGEKIPVSLNEPHMKICKNCRDAVIAMRKALGTWND